MLRARIKIDRPAFKGGGGKRRRLPAEETLQFEKKNSSHPHRALPGPYRHCKDGTAGDAVGRADCKLPLAGMCGYSAEAF